MKAIVTLLAGLLLGLAPPVTATPGEVPVGGTLREARLNGLTVPPAKLSSFRGKPLIINVWASWCGPCRAEMASLDKLAKRYKGKPFKVIGISTDDYPEKAYDFLERTGIGFENFIDARLELENMLGANRLPLTLLIDAQGKVLVKHYGAKDWDSLETRQMIARTFGTQP
ncbi:MAG: TlpA family protein disulfide reductase [Rhodocyclales bacterium]|nr:TlpA family protein disulfide reductase [Rhodocyclales bacterium]